MWGIFGKPSKRAIWNTLGLHVVLTVYLRFLSFLDVACVICCLILSTGSHHVCVQNSRHMRALLQNFTEIVQSVAKPKATAAVANPLSPMKSPQKQGADNVQRTSASKQNFEKFLQALPQAENRFSDAARSSTDMVHLALWVAVGGFQAPDFIENGPADNENIQAGIPGTHEGYMRGV